MGPGRSYARSRLLVVYLLLVAIPTLLGLVVLGSTLLGLSRLTELRAVSCGDRTTWPRVSIISPACNEERHVAGAIESMLETDYPDLNVIAIDDRSTDRTGALLDGLAAQHPRLRVKHVMELPEGWLGKLNALQTGVTLADGEWLLFMDADAHLAPGALRRAITLAEERGLDCMSVVPEVAPAGLVGDAVFDVSLALMSLGGRLQNVSDPGSRHVAATGAFILVRRATFERTPGFEWLRLEVADDFGLALLIKTHGGRCDIFNGRGDVQLEWYASFTEMKRAMQKNCFAVVARFSPLRSVGLSMFSGWMALFPIAVLLDVPPAWHALTAVGALALTAASVTAAARTGRRIIPAFLWPLGFLGMAWMTLRAGIIGFRLGGIEWRGVVYPTSLLAQRQRVKV